MLHLLLVAAILAAAGCGESNSEGRDPYLADMKKARNNATSPFEKAVLDDLEITRSEYEEAVNRYVSCAQERGVRIKAVEQASRYAYEVADRTDAMEVTMERCRAGTVGLIAPLYNDKLVNPHRLPIPDLLAACLVRKGVVSGSYTGEDFEKDSADNFAGSPHIELDDPRVEQCFSDPAS